MLRVAAVGGKRSRGVWRNLSFSLKKTNIKTFSSLNLPPQINKRIHEEALASTFDPEEVEKGWQEWWQKVLEEQEKKNEKKKQEKKFTMILQPPNINGALHIGHALTITIQDALARWYRMKGYDVNWIPGLDHAGIATQVKRT